MLPSVSVVLPVYNVAPYIEATIDSILKQTFTDFELLVLDDCSTDETAVKVSAVRDPRIRLIQNTRNLGRGATDNVALQYVRGKYIAKMDGDDLCHPERLARQVTYLEQHSEVNVVGGWMQNFGDDTYLNRYPVAPADARVFTLFGLPVGNPSVMLRTQLLRQERMHYDATLRQTEDYDFFARYLEQLVVVTLPIALIQYRTFPVGQKVVLGERSQVADQVRNELLQRWGIPHSEREQRVHNTVAMIGRSLGELTLREVETWFDKIIDYNTRVPWFEPAALRQGLAQRWFEVCYNYPKARLHNILTYYQSPFAQTVSLPLSKKVKFWLHSLRYLNS